MEPLKLSTMQSFTVESFKRDIDKCKDVAQLQKLCKELLHLWQGQLAATKWIMAEETACPNTLSTFLKNNGNEL